jgi:hemerythrin
MILWRDSMSVHNELIDRDHQHLICLINSVELALHSNSSAQLESVVTQLGDYTDYHFRREERIQRAIAYPDSEAHLQAHTKLIERFNELRRQLSNLLSPNVDPALRDEVIGLLRDWLIQHLLKEDMAMKPFLAKHPVDFVA